ncbi:MAG: hypothetical protein ACR2JF_11800, partial [Iamia sp.]
MTSGAGDGWVETTRPSRPPAREGAPTGPRTLGAVPRDPLTSKLAGFGTSIFAEMSALAVETG